MGRVWSVVLWSLCGLMTNFTVAAADESSAYESTPFAEGTLGGWVLENGAEADIVDGVLRLKGGNGWLRSPHEYGDFELHLEWQALQAIQYDAGIYIRAEKEGAPFPKAAYQINLLQGKEGNIGNVKGASSEGLAKPPGQWNVFDIRVVGDRVAVQINGQPAYDVDGLTRAQGYIGFQIEVPLGGQFLIRNVRLKELGFVSLFNGKDLAGWSGADGAAEACWHVEQGLLVCDGKKGPWLRTAQEYGDFNLRFDYLVSSGGNSGVYVRVPADGLHHRENDTLPPAGFEVQLLDDADPKYATLKPYQYGASVYDICGAEPRVTRPAGEWNTLEINCRGQHVRTVHNGQVVVDITADTHPLLALRKTSGFLGLQNHSTVVKFRNLRVGPALE